MFISPNSQNNTKGNKAVGNNKKLNISQIPSAVEDMKQQQLPQSFGRRTNF